MRVQLLCQRASFRAVYEEGDIVDLPMREAKRLIDAGEAIPVRTTPTERAVRSKAAERT